MQILVSRLISHCGEMEGCNGPTLEGVEMLPGILPFLPHTQRVLCLHALGCEVMLPKEDTMLTILPATANPKHLAFDTGLAEPACFPRECSQELAPIPACSPFLQVLPP